MTMTLGEWSPLIPCDVLEEEPGDEVTLGAWSPLIPCDLFDAADVNPAVMLTADGLRALVPQD